MQPPRSGRIVQVAVPVGYGGPLAIGAARPQEGIALQKKNRSELIRAALMKLSADDRDILNLVYFHENSVEDCALILNLPVATVKTRMFYARKKLAELVQGA
jgi:RNA polymerase sigma factor (sigma-70 family)